MKTFTINDKEYQYPESLREVTLGDFIDLSNLQGEGEQLRGDIVQVLTKVEKEILDEAGPRLVLELYNHLIPVLDVEQIDSTTLVRTFELERMRFFTTAPEDISWAEYSAIDQIDRRFGGKNDSIPYLLATVCRLPGESYQEANTPQEKMRDRVEMMKKLDLQTAYSIRSFFFESYLRFQIDSRNFSEVQNLEKAWIQTLQEMVRTDSTSGSTSTMGQGTSLTLLHRIWLKCLLYFLCEPWKSSISSNTESISRSFKKGIQRVKKIFTPANAKI